MRYLSLFSGIESAAVAAKNLNWKVAAFSEIADFPCAVLKHLGECRINTNSSTLLGRMGTGGNNIPVTVTDLSLRKLTPLECERLQGFPDNYTDIPYKNKEHSPLGKRYEAIGNAIAVPVLRWIFNRMDIVESLLKKR